MNKLGPQQLRAFIEVVNAYDPSIFNTIQFNATTPLDELVNDLIFHNQRHRYRFTRKNNPVRYETSRNIGVAMNTQDRPQNNERYAGADLSCSAAPPSRDARDARTNGAQAEERPLKSPHLSSRERFPAQPSASCSTTNPPPEEPRQPPRCCICGGDIQV